MGVKNVFNRLTVELIGDNTLVFISICPLDLLSFLLILFRFSTRRRLFFFSTVHQIDSPLLEWWQVIWLHNKTVFPHTHTYKKRERERHRQKASSASCCGWGGNLSIDQLDGIRNPWASKRERSQFINHLSEEKVATVSCEFPSLFCASTLAAHIVYSNTVSVYNEGRVSLSLFLAVIQSHRLSLRDFVCQGSSSLPSSPNENWRENSSLLSTLSSDLWWRVASSIQERDTRGDQPPRHPTLLWRHPLLSPLQSEIPSTKKKINQSNQKRNRKLNQKMLGKHPVNL